MDNKDIPDTKGKSEKTYSVSSRSSRPRKTVSLSMPTVPKPSISYDRFDKFIHTTIGLIVIIVLVGLLSGFGGAWLEQRDNQNTGIFSTELGNQKKIVTTQSQLISSIAKTVGPSVVSVNVNIDSSSSSDDSGLSQFGFSQPDQTEQAAGTGIIIDSSGIVMTNRHVVPVGTTSVSVTLSDGTQLNDVSVIGRTSDTDNLDIAFLKINNTEGHKLIPANIGDSSTVQVGDDVVAIGNALGQFQNTVTSGIISGYGRSVEATDSNGDPSTAENLDDLFQTDAAINEGNSGGPLVNLNGQVIGVNVATAGDAQNIGFSIPINDVKGLIEQVIKTGTFTRPYLGIRYVVLTPDVASEYNLSVQQGAFIAPSSDPTNPSVTSGSPADQAGIQTNDIITQVNGVNVDETHSLTSLLSPLVPGDKINLTIVRGTQTLHVSVTLGTEPSS